MTASRPPHRAVRTIAFAAAALSLAGCASLSPDGGMTSVSQLTEQRTGYPVARVKGADQRAATAARVAALLKQPLEPNTAVEIALLNNPGLQAAFAELGVADADVVQAGRLRNPGLQFDHLRAGGQVEIDRAIVFDVAGLLTLPLRSGIAQRRFEQAKLQAAMTAVRLAADTRRAYFEAVAAVQGERYRTQVMASAQAAATLAARMQAAGNWSRLDAAREQAFYAETTAELARARQQAVAGRERLTRLLGLWGEDAAFQLPERLPELPPAPSAPGPLEAQAMRQRLDVQIARRDVDATAASLGLTRATGFVNVLDAGYANKSQSGQPRENGYQISLELPIFDWGTAKNAKAEAFYMQALQRAANTAIQARSEVREAYAAYRTQYDLARHYRDEVVPLHKQISDELRLRYTGMLVSVFELLTDAREQAAAVNRAIAAQRDFWIADSRLADALSGAGSAAAVDTAASAATGTGALPASPTH